MTIITKFQLTKIFKKWRCRHSPNDVNLENEYIMQNFPNSMKSQCIPNDLIFTANNLVVNFEA